MYLALIIFILTWLNNLVHTVSIFLYIFLRSFNLYSFVYLMSSVSLVRAWQCGKWLIIVEHNQMFLTKLDFTDNMQNHALYTVLCVLSWEHKCLGIQLSVKSSLSTDSTLAIWYEVHLI